MSTINWKTAFECMIESSRAYTKRTINKNGSSCLITHHKDHTLIAFRGTEIDRMKDLLTDANIRVNKFGIHAGFYNYYEQLEMPIYEYLKERKLLNKPIRFTGHSLGAAAAVIAGWYFNNYFGLKVIDVYAFGCPRAFNKTWKELFSRRMPPVYRIINELDPVTAVPGRPYVHVGEHWYLPPAPGYPVRSISLRKRLFQWFLKTKPWMLHEEISYLEKLKAIVYRPE